MDKHKLDNLEKLNISNKGISELPNEIGKLSNLKVLLVHNNNIKVFPQSISKLKNLETLGIENTKIPDIPIDLLKHKNLNSLSINDELLEFISQNIQYLNIDTINLTASNFQESSKIVQELNLNIDTKIWIEDRDKLDNGCVKLFKYKEENK